MKKFPDSDSSVRQKRKWRYSPEARKARYCTTCMKRLKKDEVIICNECYSDLLKNGGRDNENA